FVGRQPESNAATIGEAGGDAPRPERDGNRDDRGNREGGGGGGGRFRGRRRRGRRGRGGMPDNKFAGGSQQERQPGQGQESPRAEMSEPEAMEPEGVEGEQSFERPDYENIGNRVEQHDAPRAAQPPQQDRGGRGEQRPPQGDRSGRGGFGGGGRD